MLRVRDLSGFVARNLSGASRTRLGAEVMHTIAERALTPLAQPQTAGAFYRGLRVVSIDGATLEVADEAGNRKAFGVPGAGQDQAGYPQIRCVGLLENGTHAFFGVALGGYKDSEVSLAHQAIKEPQARHVVSG